MAAPSQSPIRPVLRLVGFFAGVMLLVVIAQIVLNPPERRPDVACWPLYLTGKFFSVTLVRVLLPDEHLFVLENLIRCERFHGWCVGKASMIPGFRAGSSGLIDRLKTQSDTLMNKSTQATPAGDDDDE